MTNIDSKIIPKVTAIELTQEKLVLLEGFVRSTKTDYRLSQGSRIVLLAANGMSTWAIGRKVMHGQLRNIYRNLLSVQIEIEITLSQNYAPGIREFLRATTPNRLTSIRFGVDFDGSDYLKNHGLILQTTELDPLFAKSFTFCLRPKRSFAT